MTIESSHLQLGELSIAYRRAGKGPPLALLHGFLCDSRCIIADLADHFDVIAWDDPGAGSYTDPAAPFTLTDWSGCLAGFLDALGVGQAHVLGLSWGGVLAQEFYGRCPTRVSRLILADTDAGWKGSLPSLDVERRLSRCEQDSTLSPKDFVPRWVGEMFTADAPPALVAELSAVMADFHPSGFRLMARSLADTDTADLLPTIAAPTLVLWGDDDRRSPILIAGQLRAAIAGAELQVIKHDQADPHVPPCPFGLASATYAGNSARRREAHEK